MSGMVTLVMQAELMLGRQPLSVMTCTLILTTVRGGMVSRLQSFIVPKLQEGPPFHKNLHWSGQ